MVSVDPPRARPVPTSASYSITVRLLADPDPAVVGRIATAIGAAGAVVTAIDVAESRHDRITIDVTCSAVNGEHADEVVAALEAVDEVTVHKVSDRTFLLHIGGKIETHSKVPLRTRDDLSMAYTPGVARVCLALARNPDDVRRLTVKGNSVAVVTDGTAVLGLGDLGPGAALPVMEGKAALFKRFADIDAWPICLDTTDVDEIVAGGPGDRARLRRDQPGGHQRAALLRGGAPAARPAGHPGLPRRPARHGDRRARRAHQRAALCPQATRGRPGGGLPAPARPAPRWSTCCWRPACGGCWCGTARASWRRATGGCPAPSAGWPSGPTRPA